jgi:hypothetical protein
MDGNKALVIFAALVVQFRLVLAIGRGECLHVAVSKSGQISVGQFCP